MKSSHSPNPNRRQFLKSAVLSGVGMAAVGIGIPSALARSAAKPLVLAKQGKSAYSIVISESASPSEQRAAGELQRFIEEMSGARLPIVTDAEETGRQHGTGGPEQRPRQARLENTLRRTWAPRVLCCERPGRTSSSPEAGSAARCTGSTRFSTSWAAAGSRPTSASSPKEPTLVVQPLNESAEARLRISRALLYRSRGQRLGSAQPGERFFPEPR